MFPKSCKYILCIKSTFIFVDDPHYAVQDNIEVITVTLIKVSEYMSLESLIYLGQADYP